MIRVHVANEPLRTAARSAVVVPGSTSQLINDSDFVSDAAYVHTDSNYTAAEKSKLAGIAPGAEVNVLTAVKVNGTALTPDGNRGVNVTVPTAVSDLANDSNYQTAAQVAAAIADEAAGGVIVTDADHAIRYRAQCRLVGGKPVVEYNAI